MQTHNDVNHLSPGVRIAGKLRVSRRVVSCNLLAESEGTYARETRRPSGEVLSRSGGELLPQSGKPARAIVLWHARAPRCVAPAVLLVEPSPLTRPGTLETFSDFTL